MDRNRMLKAAWDRHPVADTMLQVIAGFRTPFVVHDVVAALDLDQVVALRAFILEAYTLLVQPGDERAMRVFHMFGEMSLACDARVTAARRSTEPRPACDARVTAARRSTEPRPACERQGQCGTAEL